MPIEICYSNKDLNPDKPELNIDDLRLKIEDLWNRSPRRRRCSLYKPEAALYLFR
jgi:hypothetical protein